MLMCDLWAWFQFSWRQTRSIIRRFDSAPVYIGVYKDLVLSVGNLVYTPNTLNTIGMSGLAINQRKNSGVLWD